MSQTHTVRAREFQVGELAEGLPWQLASPYLDTGRRGRCPHAEPVEGGWRYRVVIVCRNQGGKDATVLCLACVTSALSESARKGS